MKHIKLILISLFITIVSYAQTPIIDIEEYSFRNSIENAYYKDINNYFNPFMGTWLYTSDDGLTTFKIVLTKRTMLYTGKYYTDYVTGEYHYSNSFLDINTLSNTSINSHGIYGDGLVNSHNRPYCPDCIPGNKRLSLSLADRDRVIIEDLTLRLITVNGQPALSALIYGGGVSTYDEENPPPYFESRIPVGTFVFIKQ